MSGLERHALERELRPEFVQHRTNDVACADGCTTADDERVGLQTALDGSQHGPRVVRNDTERHRSHSRRFYLRHERIGVRIANAPDALGHADLDELIAGCKDRNCRHGIDRNPLDARDASIAT